MAFYGLMDLCTVEVLQDQTQVSAFCIEMPPDRVVGRPSTYLRRKMRCWYYLAIVYSSAG